MNSEYAALGVILWIGAVLLTIGFAIFLIWFQYWLMKVAVKNGTLAAHEELDRRAYDRERLALSSRSKTDERAPRLREPDWRADR